MLMGRAQQHPKQITHKKQNEFFLFFFAFRTYFNFLTLLTVLSQPGCAFGHDRRQFNDGVDSLALFFCLSKFFHFKKKKKKSTCKKNQTKKKKELFLQFLSTQSLIWLRARIFVSIFEISPCVYVLCWILTVSLPTLPIEKSLGEAVITCKNVTKGEKKKPKQKKKKKKILST